MREHILLAGNWRWPVYAPAFARALEELGHQVTPFQFNWFLKGKGQSLRLAIKYDPMVLALNLSLLKTANAERPSIILIWNGLAVYPSTIKLLKRQSFVAGYTNDDPFGPRGQSAFWNIFRSAIAHYDCHHVYRHLNIAEYNAAGAVNVGVMQAGHVPAFHYPDLTPAPEPDDEAFLRTIAGRAVFIGNGKKECADTMAALSQAGVPVTLCGPQASWKPYMAQIHGVDKRLAFVEPSLYRRIISRAGICLGFLSRENRDDYTRRFFEIPACGGFLLAERTATALTLYQEGVEAEFFSDLDELKAKCTFYLDHEAQRKAIMAAGYLRATGSGYDIGSRAAQWLAEVQNIRGK